VHQLEKNTVEFIVCLKRSEDVQNAVH